MSMTLGIPTSYLITFILVFARVGAWLWITPPFGGRMLPATVRVLLAVAIAMPLTPAAALATTSVPTTIIGLIGEVVVQVIIGAALGLVCLTLISAVQSAGSAIDVFGGFSLSQAYDPMLMQQSSVMGRVYQLLTGVLLLVTGAYFVLLSGFANTFDALPVDQMFSPAAIASTLGTSITTFFIATLQIAGPLIGIMVIADLGLGLLNRVAPALNAFSLGFPLKIGLTLILIGLAIPLLPTAVTALADLAASAMGAMVGG